MSEGGGVEGHDMVIFHESLFVAGEEGEHGQREADGRQYSRYCCEDLHGDGVARKVEMSQVVSLGL